LKGDAAGVVLGGSDELTIMFLSIFHRCSPVGTSDQKTYGCCSCARMEDIVLELSVNKPCDSSCSRECLRSCWRRTLGDAAWFSLTLSFASMLSFATRFWSAMRWIAGSNGSKIGVVGLECSKSSVSDDAADRGEEGDIDSCPALSMLPETRVAALTIE
jgi:hypothetical protein